MRNVNTQRSKCDTRNSRLKFLLVRCNHCGIHPLPVGGKSWRLIECCVVLLSVCLITPNARGWNSTGHMTVAELTWRAMSTSERNAISELLRHHPHFSELLEKDLKPGV